MYLTTVKRKRKSEHCAKIKCSVNVFNNSDFLVQGEQKIRSDYANLFFVLGSFQCRLGHVICYISSCEGRDKLA